MILQELVQHVEEIMLHQRLNHQLVQVMLKDARQDNNTSLSGGLSWEQDGVISKLFVFLPVQ